MKLATIIFLSVSLQVCARGFSQNISLSFQDAKLETIFRSIEAQSHFHFVYSNEAIEKAIPISVIIQNVSLEKALELCFVNQPLFYTINDNYIIVKVKNAKHAVDTVRILRGIVADDNNIPLGGITVVVKRTGSAVATNTAGEFMLKNVRAGDILVFSGISSETKEVIAGENHTIFVHLQARVSSLGDVTVSVNNGYQEIPPERATGSFDVIDNKLINRSVTTNVLDRIENLTPGILFDKNTNAPDPLLIRGRSTIYANTAPLIVLDNFPYDGDLGNLNPNDIESITVLKDASAAGIWGARAGNGVIVITTKKGRSAKPSVQVSTSISFQQKPSLSSISSISSADFINLEKNLYSQGYYTGILGDRGNVAVTPVVELLNAESQGSISATDANSQLEAQKGYNLQQQESKYFYQLAINQQHAVNVSGSNNQVSYYLSAGWDHNLQSLVSDSYNRITIRTKNTFRLSSSLSFDAGINYVNSQTESGSNPGYSLGTNPYGYPYMLLADNAGIPLAVNFGYRNAFKENAIQNGLLDWSYSPLEDIHTANNNTGIKDIVANTALHARILSWLNAEVKYQYENSLTDGLNIYNQNSYYARNLINSFVQLNGSGNPIFPVPVGGIADLNHAEIISQQGRFQLNLDKTWNQKHDLHGIAGYEIRSIVNSSNAFRYYGYQSDIASLSTLVDYTTQYPQYYNNAISLFIPNNQSVAKTTDHFISWFMNAEYSYMKRFYISGSARLDQANLFGVHTNQKGTPLWSVGLNWILSNEKFYRVSWLSDLKVRATYGYSGNISRKSSAYATASYSTGLTTGAMDAYIQNPPNPDLRWERDGIVNLGIDFSLTNKAIKGTLEYYHKNLTDLMGQAPADPTLGLYQNNAAGSGAYFYGNVAAMKGNGIDFQISSRNIDKKFKWMTTFLFSRAITTVTRYLMPVTGAGNAYFTANSVDINPLLGKPIFAMYSFKWAGLDPTNGNPRGYLNGSTSEDYSTIYAKSPVDSLVYNGPVQPVYFGAIRNTFSWKNWSLSINISYKMGYFFRKASALNYTDLFSFWAGSGEYARRWQKQGDEKITNVPSLQYPADISRDNFYQYSSVNVLKGDNIRLEDINLGYDLNKNNLKKMPFSRLHFYLYASNLGMLWVANREHIDPYYNNTPRIGQNTAVGINANF